MKIHFTKKDYLLLLDMIYLSDWIMHAHEVGIISNDYKALRKKILSYFKEMGADDRIEYVNDNYYETKEYDELLHEKFIEPYDQENFWEELAEQLASRDAIKAVGMEAFKKMDWLERMDEIDKAKEKYQEEFEKHGIENLKILLPQTD